MNVLVACEESQRVCIAFLERGHNTFSCDIVEPSGGRPDRHILEDALKVIQGGKIVTMDNRTHNIPKWDLIIAHPPCTHLAVSGARWFKEGKKPLSLQKDAIDFFMKFVYADCDKICIENPVSVMSTKYRKPDQIIQPWMFGEMQQKKTCLWLKGLPLLHETENVYEDMIKLPINERAKIWRMPPSPERAKERSKTFYGIAKAMSEQWG